MAGDEESMSLAETNRVRAELGLAPLADEDAGEAADLSDDPDAQAEANYAQRRAEEKQARAEKEAKERLAKAKNQRELRAKLQGKGLGEAEAKDAEGGTASDWVKQSRKRAKERAAELEKMKQREREMEERDREAAKYGEEDLAGLKVAHGEDDFEEGKDVVLTLADRKVLEDDDDELQNVNLAEYARTNKALDLKKRGKDAYKYTGYDDDEFNNDGQPRGVLSKYDEELGIDPSKDGQGFKIGSSAANPGESSAKAEAKAAKLEEEQRKLNRQLLSLDYEKTEQNDYLQEGDVGFKKSNKKKKSKSGRRTAAADDDDPANVDTNGDATMQGDAEDESKPKLPTAERRLAREGTSDAGNVIDDDDLQAALARQRRAANKKRVQKIRGEDLAQQIMAERGASAGVDSPMPTNGTMASNEHAEAMADPVVKQEEVEDDDDDRTGLVLDDTSEFVRTIQARPAVNPNISRVKRESGTATPQGSTSVLPRVKSEPAEDGVPIDEMSAKVEDDGPEEGEADEGEMEEDDYYRGNGMDLDRSPSADVKPDIKGKGRAEVHDAAAFGSTADEKLVSGGMANTLALLRQTGLVKGQTQEEKEREAAYREQQRFIAESRAREARREVERARLKAASMTATAQAGSNKQNNAELQAQREYENKQRQHQYAQEQLDAFKEYKPNVEIKYHDEFGRSMTPKEAWKDLSHKFHGKGSGFTKREKLLKKVEDERKRAAMSSGDTPLSTNAAFQARQERMGSATMVLGVGNKNTAPSADVLLGPANGAGRDVSKGKGATAGSTAKKRKLEPKVLG